MYVVLGAVFLKVRHVFHLDRHGWQGFLYDVVFISVEVVLLLHAVRVWTGSRPGRGKDRSGR
ncbi:hypothetical protein L248_0905 [Schleiferilactobacillus shenzhenensis LY-73]|uniref:Uncharacterized protein n=2 Tax=Schleiferilactobacillus shenzhenensis TaxID=1231337 RepID=U4TJW6_9LACO|nr:hypothetical protein L248_0905 [Schleiferilactobacillus shenzhenensis LY-73]